MLKNERVNPQQFLDRIVHIYTNKFDEISAHIFETLEIEENSDVEEMFGDLTVHEPQQEQPLQQHPKKGQCISCRLAQCDIILLPCFHIVVCSDCWKIQVDNHEKQCKIEFKNNKRKLALESKRVQCPCCENIVSRSQEFFMATING